MSLPLVAGLGMGLFGSIAKIFGRGKANRQLESLLGQDPTYMENPIVKQRLGLAQTLLNARMPGAATVERNIYANQGNQLARVDRNATDASQALAAAAGIGANTDKSLEQLGVDEAGDYNRRLGNLFSAQEGVINEGDKVFQDKIRRYGDLMQIRGAQNENRQNNWGDISNFGFSLANFGLNGGFGNGGSGNRSSLSYPGRMNGMLSTMPTKAQLNDRTMPTPRGVPSLFTRNP